VTGRPTVQRLDDHEYLVRLNEGDDVIEIQLRASPAVLARIGVVDTEEGLVVDATVSYLIARQRADDLPTKLDLEDVAAAYDGYIEHIRDQVRRS
jgi:hypothetical protein